MALPSPGATRLTRRTRTGPLPGNRGRCRCGSGATLLLRHRGGGDREVGPFALGDGTVLPALRVAYRHDGPGPDEAPQVLAIHALTGSADAAGDWWAPLIGPGRALDTTRVGVLCANLLGGCYGTTGPTSLDPATGEPFGSAFPAVSTRDQARAQWALLDALGVRRLAR